MRETLIQFETAKLAKEKGSPLLAGDIYLSDGTNTDLITIIGKGKTFYYAPTQYLLQRWLREEKRLVVDISFCSLGYKSSVLHSDGMRVQFTGSIRDRYEEALEAGLLEALKLI